MLADPAATAALSGSMAASTPGPRVQNATAIRAPTTAEAAIASASTSPSQPSRPAPVVRETMAWTPVSKPNNRASTTP